MFFLCFFMINLIFLQLIILLTSLTNLQKRKYTAININIKKEIYKYIMANSYIKQITITFFFNSKYGLEINRTIINKIQQNHKQQLSILLNLQTLKNFK